MHTDNPFTAHAKTWMTNLVIMDDVAAAPGKNVNLNGTLRVHEWGLRVRICNNGKLGAELFDVKRTMANSTRFEKER